MSPGWTEIKWWAWVDLNHLPRPCQRSVVRFYNGLQDRGTAKLPGSCTRQRIPWVGLWAGKSSWAYSGRRTPCGSL